VRYDLTTVALVLSDHCMKKMLFLVVDKMRKVLSPTKIPARTARRQSALALPKPCCKRNSMPWILSPEVING